MLKLSNVHKIYNAGKSNEFEALKGISIEIADGEMVAIIGKSGAGKSTLLHILSCVDNYEKGEYYLDGKLVKSESEKSLARIRNEKIGMVMQDFALIEDFSSIDNVMLPLDFAKKKKRSRRQLAVNALESVGMEKMAEKTVNQLSGGQKQRVAIARAIVNDPQIILADEPTGALDSKNSTEIMKLFKILNNQGRTVVIVTHDSNVARMCNRVIDISDGKVAE